MKNIDFNKTSEIWQQDFFDPNLWHSETGTIITSDLLETREFYYNVIKLNHDFTEPEYHLLHA